MSYVSYVRRKQELVTVSYVSYVRKETGIGKSELCELCEEGNRNW